MYRSFDERLFQGTRESLTPSRPYVGLIKSGRSPIVEPGVTVQFATVVE